MRLSRRASRAIVIAVWVSFALLSACYSAVDGETTGSQLKQGGSNKFVPAEAPSMPPIPEGAGPAPPRPSTPQDSGGGGGGDNDSGPDTGAPIDDDAGPE
ncbi:MAG TPA: hypothetical protein VM580_24985 [Labilithrix sp.]|jgi:hypothetical protein|nr:hypothetical protein [Labilithrix sp.]